MVADRSFPERYLTASESLILEQAPMRSAVADGQMNAYIHHGFWQCMDTMREYKMLNDLWEKGNAPWTAGW
jgi:glucose-1-phosphate cytidylyltransferase